MRRITSRTNPCGLLWLSAGLFFSFNAFVAATADEHNHYVGRYIKEKYRAYLSKSTSRASIIELKNALQQALENAEARLLLGATYLQTGNAVSAIKELEQVRDLGLPRERWIVLLGRAYLLQGEPERVLASINTEPDDSDAIQGDVLATRGAAEIALGNTDQAKDSFMRALALNANSYDALMGVVQLALLDNDAPEAAKLIERAISLDEKRAEGWIFKGKTHLIQQQYDDALNAFSRVLELQPGNVVALIGRAETLLAQGKPEQALVYAEKLQKAKPAYVPASYLIARAMAQQGDIDAAAGTLQGVLMMAPDHLPSHLMLGALHYQLGQMEQAEAYLYPFVAAAPDYLPARKLLAATEIKLNNPQKAIDLLGMVQNQAEEDAQFLALLGSAHLQNGNYVKGSELLQRAVEIAPDVSAIRTQLVLSHIAGDYSYQAIAELDTAIDLGRSLISADVLSILAHIRNNDYDQAIAAATALVDKMPEDPMLHNLLGVAYRATGNTKQARQAFQDTLRLHPSFHSARLNLAQLDVQQGDFDAASGHYLSILDDDANNLDAMLGLATLAQHGGNEDEFLEWVEKAWDKNPHSISTGIILVRQYLERNENSEALNVARKLQADNPDSPATLRTLGLALLANNQPADALTTFRRLVDLQPDSPEAWHLIATSHLRTQNYEDAAAALDKALSLQSDYIPSLVVKTQLYISNKYYLEALATARHIETLENTRGLGFKLEGDVLMQQENFEQAARAYQAAYDAFANSQLALLLSHAHRRAGNKEAALTALRKWLAVEPTDTRIRTQLAMYLDQMNRWTDAIAEYEQIIEQQPNNFVILNNLAWLYSLKGDSRGVVYAEKANELAPERPEIADTLGWILVQRDQAQRGLVLLQQAALQAPHIPGIRYHLAVAYNKVGRDDEAKRELESLFRTDAPFQDSDDARQLLEQLQTQ